MAFLCDIPNVDHLAPKRVLNSAEQTVMRKWAKDFGKSVHQRTVRQETTKFKAGTLHLNMYKQSAVPTAYNQNASVQNFGV